MANFRDAGIYGDYVHEAFSNPHAEIRLVLIDQSGDKDSEIHCTISTHPVNCLPAYNAISYTWGDTTATSKKHRVWVNGKQVNVGHNSWLALWQSRLHFVGATLWIWIDVLSIDHTNDGEKSIQVGMMGHIYQTASSVLASVGDHENDSEFLAEQIYAHIGYINHWRQKDGQRRNPPPKHCCGCGRQRGAPGQLHMLFDNSIELEHHASKEVMHRCTNCTVDFVFCDSCAGDHERPGHTLVGNPLRSYHEVFRKCTRCGQYLPLRWYAAKTGGNIKHCESCKQLDDNGATDADLELVLSDEWGPIDTGVGYLGLSAAPSKWETCRRFSEMSVDSRQRMMDALLVFSMRPYFTRLWVVQEVKRSHPTFIACGNALFPLAATTLFAKDAGEYHESQTHISSHLRDMLLWRNSSMSIWDVGSLHYDYHCMDARDRVFSLLTLAARGPLEAQIRPDYTKTILQVLLQLLEHQVCDVTDDYNRRFAMTETSNVIGGFNLGTLAVEMADLLQSRRSIHAATSPPTQEAVFDHQSQRRIILEARWSCTIWKDEAGKMVTSLLRESTPDTQIRGHDFQYVQKHTEDTAVKIYNHLGRVVALADKNVKAGDQLLFFSNEGPSAYPAYGLCPPFAGLIVRPIDCGIHIIVGQFIIDYGIKPCQSPCSCVADSGKQRHGFEPENWWVYMSPEDLLLFVVQDMMSEASLPNDGVGPVMKLSVRREETAERFITSITTDPVSSYAIRRQEFIGRVFKWGYRFHQFMRLDPGKWSSQSWTEGGDGLMKVELFDSKESRRLRFLERTGVDLDLI